MSPTPSWLYDLCVILELFCGFGFQCHKVHGFLTGKHGWLQPEASKKQVRAWHKGESLRTWKWDSNISPWSGWNNVTCSQVTCSSSKNRPANDHQGCSCTQCTYHSVVTTKSPWQLSCLSVGIRRRVMAWDGIMRWIHPEVKFYFKFFSFISFPMLMCSDLFWV